MIGRWSLLVVLVLALAVSGCQEGASPAPKPSLVEPDWVEIADQRFPARVFSAPTHGVEILWGPPRPSGDWARHPVAWVWTDEWPRTNRLRLPADGQVRDVVFLDVGGRAQGVFESVSCQSLSSGQCVLETPLPAMSVVVMQAGSLRQLGVERATQFRWGQADSSPKVEVIPLGLAL